MRIRYDFHMHSALSPCADNDMTPNNMVNMAKLLGFDAIAITDHNACGNCAAAMAVGQAVGLTVLPGMELCTSEEIHVVCLFPTCAAAEAFAAEVYAALPPIDNRPDIFGDQLIMNADDEVTAHEPRLLGTASGISVDDVLPLARRFGGTAFPAHIDRPSYSMLSAFGDIPPLGFATYEVSAVGDAAALTAQYAELRDKCILHDSDAHALEMMREPQAELEVPENTPAAIVRVLDERG